MFFYKSPTVHAAVYLRICYSIDELTYGLPGTSLEHAITYNFPHSAEVGPSLAAPIQAQQSMIDYVKNSPRNSHNSFHVQNGIDVLIYVRKCPC